MHKISHLFLLFLLFFIFISVFCCIFLWFGLYHRKIFFTILFAFIYVAISYDKFRDLQKIFYSNLMTISLLYILSFLLLLLVLFCIYQVALCIFLLVFSRRHLVHNQFYNLLVLDYRFCQCNINL